MILNLEFKNYRSFKGICSFTTEPTSSKAKAENLCDVETIAEGNKKALKISLIFGANASGKTNIIKFLYGFRRWVLNLDNRVGENIALYQPFKFDSATVNAPIEFAMEFIAQKVRYKYEVRFTRLQIEAESLISYPNGKQTQLFERILLPEDKESDTLKFGASLSTFKPFQVFKNQLLISKFLKDTPCEPITNAARYLADIVISNGFHEDTMLGEDKETYKYYSTQRPIDIGTYPNSYFNRPVHMDLYFTRLEVTGEAFQACGAITYAQPLTEREMQDYELRPSRENLDIRRQMDAQAQVVGKWEDAHHVPEQRRLTWFYPDFGSYVAKEYVTPEQLTARARGVERQVAAKAHKQAKEKQPIAEQIKAAQREALEHREPEAPKKKAPDRGER